MILKWVIVVLHQGPSKADHPFMANNASFPTVFFEICLENQVAVPSSSPIQPAQPGRQEPGLWISRDHPERLQEAVICLLGRHQASATEAQNFLTYARENRLDLDNLLACPASGASQEAPLAFAALCAINSGRTAMLLTSPPISKAETTPIAALASFAISQLDRKKVHLVQSLIAPEDHLAQQALLEAGLKELAVLHYMERPARTAMPDCLPLPEDLELHAYSQDDDSDVLSALDSSYEGTLDCPGLHGLRQTADILAGHKATGNAELNLWWVLRQDKKPLGAIMLASHMNANSLELTYLGVAKAARHRGAGAAMLKHALQTAEQIHPRKCHLAVDVNNVPAIALYGRFGFRSILKRQALIYALHD